VHAMVQLKSAPTAADIADLKSAGITIHGSGAGLVMAVTASKSELSSASIANKIRWVGEFRAEDKVSQALQRSDDSVPHKVLMSFFPDVSESDALSIAGNAGVSVYRNSYLSGSYMVVTASKDQVAVACACCRFPDFRRSGLCL